MLEATSSYSRTYGMSMLQDFPIILQLGDFKLQPHVWIVADSCVFETRIAVQTVKIDRECEGALKSVPEKGDVWDNFRTEQYE